ncbi:MAG: bifunctional phosphopantothenoylcysteine decarboxylase/phosphopantothenate--cysteine ligase CoaBC [Bdellovibrionales bacterium]|nr:bifunctional phosphopantothenoylcysteine decarboxylase/phosphopantothenate--cysteine ligase CoaBC [Bdellovibrionales bacterium]
MSKCKILFFITGSISAYKACEALSLLSKSGHEVKVGLSDSAKNFIGPATIEGLTGHPPLGDLFQTGSAMDHIALARWADILVVAPATANTLNRLSSGLADDLLGALFLAWTNKPIVFAPAMNSMMLQHPAVVASMKKLRDWGHSLFPTEEGRLACGEVGPGRLIDPQELASRIVHIAHSNKLAQKKMKVLVVSGGTQEPVDSVRTLTNISTGQTGSTIFQRIYEDGHEVTLLNAKSALRPPATSHIHFFTTYESLKNQLNFLLSNNHYDAIIQLAAVSDFSLSVDPSLTPPQSKKLSSSKDLTLTLKRNEKLINQVKSWSLNKNIFVCGFKLTDTEDQELRQASIEKLFTDAQCSAVVHNDYSELATGKRVFSVYEANGNLFSSHLTALDLTETLLKAIQNVIENPSFRDVPSRTHVSINCSELKGEDHDLMS